MSIGLPGFESNLVKFEIPLTIARSSEEKIRQILNHMKTKNINQNDVEIIKAILESCKCHKYTESRILRTRSFELFPKKVIINSHVKEID